MFHWFFIISAKRLLLKTETKLALKVSSSNKSDEAFCFSSFLSAVFVWMHGSTTLVPVSFLFYLFNFVTLGKWTIELLSSCLWFNLPEKYFTGASLVINTSWKNPSGEWHVGYKLVYELFTETLTSRLKVVLQFYEIF